MPNVSVIVALAILVITAAVYDLKYRRIPNWLTLGGALAGLVLNGIAGPGLAGALFSLKGLAVGFGLYFALYALHAMGAGDVKLMGAVGALVGWHVWLIVFLCTALLGGAAALVLAAARKRLGSTFWNLGFILSEARNLRPAYLGKEELDVNSSKSLGLPHGAVIAVGAACAMCLQAYYGV